MPRQALPGRRRFSVVFVNLELNETSAEQLVTGISFEVGTDGLDTWSSLDFNPGLLGTARSAVAVLGATPTSTIDDVVFDFGAPDGFLGGTCGSNPDSVTIPEPVTIVVWSLLGFWVWCTVTAADGGAEYDRWTFAGPRPGRRAGRDIWNRDIWNRDI